ncbi:Rho GTPase-activating protein 1 [Balamuthia mandrillaris]
MLPTKGSSDPFCRIFWRGMEFKTRVHKRTLCPVWNETFELGTFHQNETILVTCWDKDRRGSDFEGQCRIPLLDCDSGYTDKTMQPGTYSKRLVLTDRGKPRDGPVTGTLDVIITIAEQNVNTVDEKKAFLGDWLKKRRPDKHQLVYSGILSVENVTKIFGVPLNVLMKSQEEQYGKSQGGTAIPECVRKILLALENDKFSFIEEGLFRLAGSSTRIREMREMIDSGQEVDFEKEARDNNGDLLKQFVRELPDPLFTRALENEWFKVADINSEQEKVAQIKSCMSQLPKHHLELTKALFAFFLKLSERAEENKMTPNNIGIVWGPNFVHISGGPESQHFYKAIADIVELMIRQYSDIFVEDTAAEEGEQEGYIAQSNYNAGGTTPLNTYPPIQTRYAAGEDEWGVGSEGRVWKAEGGGTENWTSEGEWGREEWSGDSGGSSGTFCAPHIKAQRPPPPIPDAPKPRAVPPPLPSRETRGNLSPPTAQPASGSNLARPLPLPRVSSCDFSNRSATIGSPPLPRGVSGDSLSRVQSSERKASISGKSAGWVSAVPVSQQPLADAMTIVAPAAAPKVPDRVARLQYRRSVEISSLRPKATFSTLRPSSLSREAPAVSGSTDLNVKSFCAWINQMGVQASRQWLRLQDPEERLLQGMSAQDVEELVTSPAHKQELLALLDELRNNKTFFVEREASW